MLIICTWLWGTKYVRQDVDFLHAGLRRNIEQPFRFLCMTEPGLFCNYSAEIERWPIEDMWLVDKSPGCLSRMRMFDPVWQAQIGAVEGDKIVSLDLDCVVVNELDPVFDRPEPFVILQGANFSNPCPYNGSLWMLSPGAHSEVWTEFSWDAVVASTTYAFPNDQAWIHHKVPDAAGWQAGTEGVYAFKKPGWPGGDGLPQDARLVVFPGWRSPQKFRETVPWIKQHWAA
jgi:hypothetical protein